MDSNYTAKLFVNKFDPNFKLHLHFVANPEEFINSFQLDADKYWISKYGLNKELGAVDFEGKIAVYENNRFSTNSLAEFKYFNKLRSKGWEIKNYGEKEEET